MKGESKLQRFEKFDRETNVLPCWLRKLRKDLANLGRAF